MSSARRRGPGAPRALGWLRPCRPDL